MRKIILLLLISWAAHAQVRRDETITTYRNAKRIVWQSDQGIEGLSQLLSQNSGQAVLSNEGVVKLKSKKGTLPGFLLDFGQEVHGGLEIVTGMYPGNKPIKLRVRFGESVGEAMSDHGSSATNDHAMRDMEVSVPWLGKIRIGDTGFRFVRIDMLDENQDLYLREVNAAVVMRDLPYLGSFHSSDSMLNQIWQTGAYTVHLNLQDYLWDGIKRDRLVWVGDLHPEVSTVMAVFGDLEVVKKSLDLARKTTPLPEWMNGISTYSMWWLIIQRDWFRQYGDLTYLKEQEDYLKSLLKHLMNKVDADGREKLDGNRFLDWPTSNNKRAVDVGLQAMMIWTLEAGAELCKVLEDVELEKECQNLRNKMLRAKPEFTENKQATALLALAGSLDAKNASRNIIEKGGADGFSTFYGYYMLEAMAKGERVPEALKIIKEYWGGMINMGATSFWEDFDLKWTEGSTRIDEMPVPGKKDIHGDFGDYCYVGYRHSLSHGWASGPTAFLSKYVLGVNVIDKDTVEIKPELGHLSYAEGTYPTSKGILKIRHEKGRDGKVKTTYEAPAGLIVK
ncbi:alpha-L-rhamnosidase [Leadbetterella byssophila DSM 17132]|uniref:Alpha-L-rhamnosidase n=1 Tax=Leadbetterella byssophila (strain DSM 17132 / JCM 16389 / KACC 11308 / NBRC 106382 / 4M15) TaxID=649349 RepID=E4RQ86_LEAB4|nr:family 78 glycoside hydrolase catalytic domain [Leadbetterella byssophila]ADQ17461.1 alpha-L-rhamnosidase [Leadbetterella byssophila DSM 17132]